MAGRNQHHIPQFFQRGFGVRRSGKPTDIWTFTPTAPPSVGLIKKTAVAWDFYSAPSEDGSATLDDKITDAESPLALQMSALRTLPIGAQVDPASAAEVIMKLAPRSSHLRGAMESGMRQLSSGALNLFSDPTQVERLLGLDKEMPTTIFRNHFKDAIRDRKEIAYVGLPDAVLERAAFYVAKEQFDHTLAQAMPMFRNMFYDWLAGADDLVREGHNKSLENLTESGNVRRGRLETFVWSIEAAPPEGAITPDCLALGYEPGEPISPLMFLSRNVEAAVMPISSDRLLVGHHAGSTGFDLARFNEDAAASSHDFFLAAKDDDSFKRLAATIGARSDQLFSKAMEETLAQARSSDVGHPPESTATINDGESQPATPQPVSYEVSFLDCAQQDEAERIAAVMQGITSSLGV